MNKRQNQEQLDLIIFGDSLSTDFHVTSPLPTMIRAKLAANKGGWQKYLNLKTKSYSSVSGYIYPNPPSIRFRSKILLGAKSLHQKILKYTKNHKQYPKAFFIWIGHNNLDWFADIEKRDIKVDEYLTSYPKEMAKNTLETILNFRTLPRPAKKTPIIISGLINFKDFFDLRNKILESDHNFTHSHMTNEVFPSFRKENQKGLLTLLDNYNRELEKLINEHKASFLEHNFDLIYSDRMVYIPIKDPQILNKADAWHLSPFGQKYFADYIKDHLIEFLNR